MSNDKESHFVTEILQEDNFDKIQKLTTTKKTEDYISDFISLLYNLFRYDDLDEFNKEIFRRINKNMIASYVTATGVSQKEEFIMELTKQFLSYENQKMFNIMINKSYKNIEKFHKETKKWFYDLLNGLFNELPSIAEKQRIRSEMLTMILSVIDHLKPIQKKYQSVGVEDICMTETEKISILLDYLVATDTDDIIIEQLQDYVQKSGLNKIEAKEWEHNHDEKDDVKIIRSDLKFNINQMKNKKLTAIMNNEKTAPKEASKETKKEKQASKEPHAPARSLPQLPQLPLLISHSHSHLPLHHVAARHGNRSVTEPAARRNSKSPPAGRILAKPQLTKSEQSKVNRRIAAISRHVNPRPKISELNKLEESIETITKKLSPEQSKSLLENKLYEYSHNQLTSTYENAWAENKSKKNIIESFTKQLKTFLPNSREVVLLLTQSINNIARSQQGPRARHVLQGPVQGPVQGLTQLPIGLENPILSLQSRNQQIPFSLQNRRGPSQVSHAALLRANH